VPPHCAAESGLCQGQLGSWRSLAERNGDSLAERKGDSLAEHLEQRLSIAPEERQLRGRRALSAPVLRARYYNETAIPLRLTM
jgi:hypothetical protein